MAFLIDGDVELHGIGSYRLDAVEKIIGSEEYARTVVYAFFNTVSEHNPSDYISFGKSPTAAIDAVIAMAPHVFEALTGQDYPLAYTKHDISDMVEVYFELLLRETWATCNLQRMSMPLLVADVSIGDEMDEEERAIYPTTFSFTITNSRVLTLMHPKYGPTAMVLTSRAPRTCQVADITTADVMQIYTRDGVMEIISKHEMIAAMMDIIEMHRRANPKKLQEAK